jgi:two-component system nitrogen regulation response regulator GlnG
VLSDGHFYRVGGHQPQKANVRVIAATHQNLEERVRLGLFREDLFHRLNVIRLRLPALRERVQDVPLLARHFLTRSARELGVETKRLSDEALLRLGAFSWPGNVRQLENVCHWLTVMAPAQVVEVEDLPPELLAAVPRPAVASVAGAAAGGGVAAPPPQATGAGMARSASDSAPTSAGSSPPVPSLVEPLLASTAGASPIATDEDWIAGMEREVRSLMQSGHPEVWDTLSRRFEARMILAALEVTRGRRIEAAQRLGIGRNTITRKIQELELGD